MEIEEEAMGSASVEGHRLEERCDQQQKNVYDSYRSTKIIFQNEVFLWSLLETFRLCFYVYRCSSYQTNRYTAKVVGTYKGAN